MIADNVLIGEGVRIIHPDLVNLYGCEIGDDTQIAAFVEIQTGVRIGRHCKICAFVFMPEGVTIEDSVFIGPHVVFTNDRYPRATNGYGNLLRKGGWRMEETWVCEGASIGAGSVILPGVRIGARAMVGAGSVVVRNVMDEEIYKWPGRSSQS